jgi:hypothetical protein
MVIGRPYSALGAVDAAINHQLATTPDMSWRWERSIARDWDRANID